MLQRLTAGRGQVSPMDNGTPLSRDLHQHINRMSHLSDGDSRSKMLGSASKRWLMKGAPHVCVIGAGVAGLRCMDILLKEGIQVTMFEARTRFGGRTHQVLLGRNIVDMGPNWIHGTEQNPMVGLTEKTGTATASINEGSLMWDETGSPFKDKLRAGELYGSFWGIISDAFKHSNEASIPVEKSLKDFFKEQLDAKDLSDGDKRVIMQMSEQWGHFVGSSISKQSLKYFWLEESLEGENLFVAGTYQRVLDEIIKGVLQNEERMFQSTKALSINTLEDSDRPGTTKVQVVTEDAENVKPWTFDAVILTAPLGCLKAGKPMFNPPLPQRIRDAIRNLGYGNLEKAYITFQSPFWSGDDDPQSFPTFVNFLEPQYDKNNPTGAIVACMALSSMPVSCAHPTLLFYYHGEYGKRLTAEFQKHQRGSTEEFNAIAEAFKPYFSRLPHYEPDSALCQPIEAVATEWSADEYAGNGSYINFQVPKSRAEANAQLDKDVEALRKGCPERGLWLAGEHTAPFAALGTITGAYWSGESVARRVVAWFEGKGDPLDEEGAKGNDAATAA